MEYIKILENANYYTIKDLRFNNKFNFKLNREEIKEFIKFKENESVKLDLKSFNSNYIYYIKHDSLKSNLNDFVNYNKGYCDNNIYKSERKDVKDILMSRIISEIEGNLLIENIPTTRKDIIRVLEDKIVKTKQDVMISNMDNAIKYILEFPSFTKDNLYKLYNILSFDCLDSDLKINNNEYYRYDKVYIDNYEGCPVDLIEECMNSLFIFVNDNIANNELKYYLPHIVHYYIVYIHPYFDFNGRTARLVSLWISILSGLYDHPLYISEAINDNKKEYYNNLTYTRDMNNDLTYFLNYIFTSAISFCLVYENIDYIKTNLLNKNIELSPLETIYLKKIISNIKQDNFNYKIFLAKCYLDMTKQGALKILNKFESYGLLNSSVSNKNQKIFSFKKELLVYEV